MQEDTESDEESVTILDAAAPGEFIRRKGTDVCPGETLVEPGDCLSAAVAGVLGIARDCGCFVWHGSAGDDSWLRVTSW